MAVRRLSYVEDAVSRNISGSVTDSATTCTLDAALPAAVTAPFYAAVWDAVNYTSAQAANRAGTPQYEVVKVTSYTSATINTMVRAADGTTAVAWADGWQFDIILSLDDLDLLAGELINVKSPVWGATGDGSTDDYNALKSVVDEVNTLGGDATIFFPPGTYLIDRFETASNGNAGLRFENCDNVRIVGYGAKIESKGNWERTATTDRTITFCNFKNCSNVSIEGLELDGNVDQMTRDPVGLTEGALGCYGIEFQGGYRVSVQNVWVHHFCTDGVMIREYNNGSSRESSRWFHFRNVRSEFNARQGISCKQLNMGTFESCSFSETGQATGTYGNHAPSAGIDIEPSFATNRTDSPNTADFNCGHVSFHNCKFENNKGGALLSNSRNTQSAPNGYPDGLITEPFVFRGCQFTASSTVDNSFIILHSDSMTLEDCHIQCSPSANAQVNIGFTADNDNVHVILRNCEVRGDEATQGCRSVVDVNALVEDCRFISEADAEITVPWINIAPNNLMVFQRNYVFMPTAGNAGTDENPYVIVRPRVARDNHYESDLNGSGGAWYSINYTGAIVENERFTATSNGIRPLGLSTTPTTRYSIGDFAIANLLLGGGTNKKQHSTGTAAPTSGNYFRGDVVWNTNAGAIGKNLGWYCITDHSGGDGGTWKEFGIIQDDTAKPDFTDITLGSGPTISQGTGSPESSVTADTGSVYLRTDGAAGTTAYLKETGDGTNTGWAAIVSSAFTSEYGSIYVVNGATAQTFTDQNTWYTLDGFAANGVSSGVTADHTIDKLTIATAGDYMVSASIAFSGSASSDFEFTAAVNSTEQDPIRLKRALGAGGDVGSSSLSGVLTLAASDELTLSGRCTSGTSKAVTLVHANLSAVRVG